MRLTQETVHPFFRATEERDVGDGTFAGYLSRTRIGRDQRGREIVRPRSSTVKILPTQRGNDLVRRVVRAVRQRVRELLLVGRGKVGQIITLRNELRSGRGIALMFPQVFFRVFSILHSGHLLSMGKSVTQGRILDGAVCAKPLYEFPLEPNERPEAGEECENNRKVTEDWDESEHCKDNEP